MAKKNNFRLLLGERLLPLDLHSLAVDDSGGIIGAGRQEFNFSFVYQAIPIAIEFREVSEEAHLELHGEIGPMPFSAESHRARNDLQAIMVSANQHLTPILRKEVFRLENGYIHFCGISPIDKPVTAVSLLTAIVRFMVPLKPYLELMSVFLIPPGKATDHKTGQLRPQFRHPQRAVRPL